MLFQKEWLYVIVPTSFPYASASVDALSHKGLCDTKNDLMYDLVLNLGRIEDLNS